MLAVRGGVPDPVRLKTGDCFLLPSGRPFRLASDLTLTPSMPSRFLRPREKGGIVSYQWRRGLLYRRWPLRLYRQSCRHPVGVLPPIVHIRKESDKAAMRWSLERMRQELREPQPGGFLVAQQLAT